MLPDWYKEYLAAAAPALQQHYQENEGHIYQLDNLQKALEGWFENLIDELAADAFDLLTYSRGSYNQSDFAKRLHKLEPVPPDSVTDDEAEPTAA